MSRKSRTANDDRRAFLKGLAAAGGATALAAITGEAVAGNQTDESAPRKPEQTGYHVTPHIQTYYRKARL